jgi:hypothetical protein
MDHLCQIDYYWEEKHMLESDDSAIRQEGIRRLLNDAQKGNPQAQAIVGESYYYGSGFEQDYKQAFYWCKKASVTGAEYSNVTLGNMYEYGKGVEKDYIEAVRWYRKEVESGYTYADENIFRCLEKMKQVGLPTEEALHGFPKEFLNAYEEWFAEENSKKALCDNPTKIGDFFYMGHYFVGCDEKEAPLLWRVIGESEDKLLVVSEYCIHWLPFNERNVGSWEDSFLCAFMQDLYENGFTELEHSRIVKQEDSQDYVFALSVNEANTYFEQNRDRRATATPFAIVKGAHIVSESTLVREFADKEPGLPHAVCWWLRNRGFSPMYAADVMQDGWVCSSGDEMEEAGGVRPAMWILK